MPYLEIQLTEKLQRIVDILAPLSVGRSPECNVQLLSRAVSRRHAGFEPRPDGIYVYDLGSANGIKVNEKKVVGNHCLIDNDVVLVGDVNIRFRNASRSVNAGDTIDLRFNSPAEHLLGQALTLPGVAFLLPMNPEKLAKFRTDILRRRISRLEIDEDAKLKLQIAVNEAIDNAARHGNRSDPSLALQVAFLEDPEEFVVSVRDQGAGFDYQRHMMNLTEISALDAIANRENYGPGIGLRIMLDCVDRLQFQGNGSCVHLAKLKQDAGFFVISEDAF
jgi:anti-sigma regulatory factor (Ser/Thr protein kinase)